ncbi:MAG: sigma D regulator [Hahellaceae bacterium]|nr:sigma D regulator [Hahellaceae bacterium]
MLNRCESAKERWGGVNAIIDRWLKERQDLIVRYCDLVSRGNFESVEDALKHFRVFCQVLVDYVSAGHFEVYEQLIEEALEYNDGGVELARKIYPRIQATTESALDFNDRFDKTPEELEELNVLVPRLAELGEKLEERFILEDTLIEKLHNVHASQLA